MEEQDLKFFKMAIASTLGVLILLLITTITIAFLSDDNEYEREYQQTTTTYAVAPTQWESTATQQKEEQVYHSGCNKDPCMQQDVNQNIPPCAADPCKMRVEYGNKYFLPYPTHRYNDQYYYEDYPVYPHKVYPHYPNNQRFFHHRIIQSDYTY